MTTTITISTGKRPLTANKANAGHWSKRRRALAPWKEATTLGWVQAQRPRYSNVDLSFQAVYPKGQLPDADAIAPTVKAIIDSLVGLGLIPDDNPHHLDGVTYKIPTRNRDLEEPQIVVQITELDPTPGHHRDQCSCRKDKETAEARRLLRANH